MLLLFSFLQWKQLLFPERKLCVLGHSDTGISDHRTYTLIYYYPMWSHFFGQISPVIDVSWNFFKVSLSTNSRYLPIYILRLHVDWITLQTLAKERQFGHGDQQSNFNPGPSSDYLNLDELSKLHSPICKTLRLPPSLGSRIKWDAIGEKLNKQYLKIKIYTVKSVT